jgi:hypothetical protein
VLIPSNQDYESNKCGMAVACYCQNIPLSQWGSSPLFLFWVKFHKISTSKKKLWLQLIHTKGFLWKNWFKFPKFWRKNNFKSSNFYAKFIYWNFIYIYEVSIKI